MKNIHVQFDYTSQSLPINSIIPQIKSGLSVHNTIIVNASPGAGKSTILPLALLDEPWLNGKKILMLEPRRLAARTIALRMANLLNQDVGETVGYRIRFDNKIGQQTRIEVVTEGILTRMLQRDNALENVGLVIFDEFHERSIFADVALALCRDSQMVLRPDLKIMVMSATLDMPNLSTLLNAPVITSEGRQFPVEITYTGQRNLTLLPELVCRTIDSALKNDEGDILVFLPGEAEIRKCEEILKRNNKDISVHPLYGKLTAAQQHSAIVPHKHGKRKIVLATSIAETSITIQGVKVVVDSGYGRTLKFDTGTGLSKLTTIEIARDSAEQRAGRAGRLSPGKCYRMWNLADNERMQAHRTPEILESDLASLVLEMAQWGIYDVQKLTWLNAPPTGHLQQAIEILTSLGAINQNKITPHGRQMAEMACHPRLAHMLLMAQHTHLLPLATDIAAILEERDPLPRESGIDINLRIEALRRFRQENKMGKSFEKIEKIAASYRKLFNVHAQNTPFDVYDTGLLLVYAYPERIACARPGNNAQFQLSNGSFAMAMHTDDLAHEPWLAVAHIDAREGLGKIFLAAPLNPLDLKQMLKSEETVHWDTRKGGIVAATILRIGTIVLQSKPIEKPDKQLVINAITEAIKKEGEQLLTFTNEVKQWQNRVMCVAHWQKPNNWPDVSTANLIEKVSDWLAPHLVSVKKVDDLRKIDILQALQQTLSWKQQKLLDFLAPTKMEVPSGSKIALDYQPNGAAPILSVRLQEMFGLAETPKVNNGKIAVLLHLLSPGYKSVQVTSDLKSFWDNTYYEVRKELRARYPKHVWPDNPWTEQAIRGVKKR